MKTCGEYGGRSANGKPCGRPAKNGGLCADHLPEADETMKALKAEFVELFAAGTNSLLSAAEKIGRTPLTIWRWRQDDATFDEAVKVAQALSDPIRSTMVEDGLFKKLVAGKGSAAEYYMWLTNRDSARWKHRQLLELSGPDGGPVEFAGLNLANLSMEDIEELKKMARKAREEKGSVGG